MTQLNHYEEQALKLLDFLKPEIRHGTSAIPRPFFIELGGSPVSGKTTLCGHLYDFFKGLGFKTFIPKEGAEQFIHIPRSTPRFNLRTAHYVADMILDLGAGHQYDIVIFDRGVFDSYIWAAYWCDKDQISVAEMQAFQEHSLCRFWADDVDVAFYITCDAQTAITRRNQVGLGAHRGTVTTHQSIKKLVQFFHYAHQILQTRFSQLHLIDTTNLNEQEALEVVGQKILDALEAKTKK